MSKNNVPEIRFKGFDDEWEEKTLGDLGSVLMNKRIFKEQTFEYGDIPFYKIGTFGREADAYISKKLFEEYKRKYPYPEKGDLLISASGSIGRIVEYLGKDEYFQDSNIVWLKHDSRLINSFLKQFYTFVKWGSLEGSTIKRLYNKDILEKFITLPTPIEQSRIGSYFQHLDNLINLHQKKYDKLVTVKKAMLEKMFPKDGLDVPEIRFNGFEGNWEEKKLGDCFTERVSRSEFGDLISVTINSGVKKFKDLGRHDNSSEDKSNYKQVEIDDIVYNSMRMWQGASGYSSYRGIVSPAYTVIIPRKNIDSLFFSYMIKKPAMINLFQLRSQGITSDTWNLKFHAFSEIIIKHPVFKEQHKIGIYFQNLDNLISLHQKELKKLKSIKNACLEKMFV